MSGINEAKHGAVSVIYDAREGALGKKCSDYLLKSQTETELDPAT